MPRLLDGIIFSKMKDTLVNNMSKFQIGGKPGTRAQEHLFVFFSILELFKAQNAPLLIQSFDISRYFDRHHLLEAMHWLGEASIPKKCYRMFWEMNRKTTV